MLDQQAKALQVADNMSNPSPNPPEYIRFRHIATAELIGALIGTLFAVICGVWIISRESTFSGPMILGFICLGLAVFGLFLSWKCVKTIEISKAGIRVLSGPMTDSHTHHYRVLETGVSPEFDDEAHRAMAEEFDVELRSTSIQPLDAQGNEVGEPEFIAFEGVTKDQMTDSLRRFETVNR